MVPLPALKYRGVFCWENGQKKAVCFAPWHVFASILEWEASCHMLVGLSANFFAEYGLMRGTSCEMLAGKELGPTTECAAWIHVHFYLLQKDLD